MKFEVTSDARAVADAVAEATARDQAVLDDLFARCKDDPRLVPTSAQRLTLVLRRDEALIRLRELGERDVSVPPRVAACVDPDLARRLLLNRVHSSDPRERLDAIAELADLRDELFSEGADWSSFLAERPLAVCDEALASPDTGARIAAARLLSVARPKDLVKRLRPFLDDPALHDLVLDILLRAPIDSEILDRSIARLDGGEIPHASRDLEIVRRFALVSPRGDLADRAKEALTRRASSIRPGNSEDVVPSLHEELGSARTFVRRLMEAGPIRQDGAEAILERCVSEICRCGLLLGIPAAYARLVMGFGYRRPRRESADPLDDLSRVVRISCGAFVPKAVIYDSRPHGLAVLRMVVGSRLHRVRWLFEEPCDSFEDLLSVVSAELALFEQGGRLLVVGTDSDEDIVAFSDSSAFAGRGLVWDEEACFVIEPAVESREREPTGDELRSELASLFGEGTEGLTTRELTDKIDDEGRTALHLAAGKGRPDLVGTLLRSGFDVDVRDSRGRTPMHLATGAWSGSTVVELFEAGATIDARDEQGATPLHRAAESSHEARSIGALLDLGADVESRIEKPVRSRSTPMRIPTVLELAGGYIFQFDTPVDGQTPLHRAAALGRSTNLRFLLDNGASIDARDSLDQTPLHLAYARNRSDCVEELLRRGADADAFDSQRRIPEERRVESDRRWSKARSRVFLVYAVVGSLKALAWIILIPARFVQLVARVVRYIEP